MGHGEVTISDDVRATGNGTWELNARTLEDDVQVMRMSNEDYDRTMLTSVVMVPLLGGTANNAVLESISSNVPAFVSRLPSTEIGRLSSSRRASSVNEPMQVIRCLPGGA